MIIERIKQRNIIFKYNIADWDLNIHLIIGNKNNYIVDSGLGAASISPVLEYLGNHKNPIFLINTHYHWDHIWGNHSLREKTIISHQLCRDRILENWDEMLSKNKQFTRGAVQMCLPNLVFEDGLYFPEDKIRIFHSPGHTLDSISVFDEEEKVMNVSDNIGDTIDEIIPSIETDIELYINTLLKYKSIDFNTCVSGHNVILGKEVIDTILRKLDNLENNSAENQIDYSI